MNIVLIIFCRLLALYLLVLLLRILLSYVPSLPDPLQPVARAIRAVTDPLLLPLRGAIPPVRMGTMALDLSPLILFFGIQIVRRLLCG